MDDSQLDARFKQLEDVITNSFGTLGSQLHSLRDQIRAFRGEMCARFDAQEALLDQFERE